MMEEDDYLYERLDREAWSGWTVPSYACEKCKGTVFCRNQENTKCGKTRTLAELIVFLHRLTAWDYSSVERHCFKLMATWNGPNIFWLKKLVKT